jgi:hypothetical protein
MLTMNLCLSVAKNSRSLSMESILRLVMMLHNCRSTWLWTFLSSHKSVPSQGATLSKLSRTHPSPPCSSICKLACSETVAIWPFVPAQPVFAALPSLSLLARSPLAPCWHISAVILALLRRSCSEGARRSPGSACHRRLSVFVPNCRTLGTGVGVA